MIHISKEQLQKTLDTLEAGGVIIFPTETSYGIGCDATNTDAVRRVFEIKGRPTGKGLPIIIPSKEQVFEYVDFNESAAALAERFWPGDLNIIAPVAEDSSVVQECAQDGTQSVRVSSHPVASTLARRFGKAIVATSANRSGEDALYDIKRVKDAFREHADEIDFVLDGGSLPPRPASTTVKVVNDRIELIRQGAIEI